MIVSPLVYTLRNAVEAVDMKVPLEGLVLRLLEIPWHNGFGKLMSLVDTECLSVWHPGNDMMEIGHFCINKHFVELEWEWKLTMEALEQRKGKHQLSKTIS